MFWIQIVCNRKLFDNVIVFPSIFFKKDNFEEKNQQRTIKSMQNYPACKELKGNFHIKEKSYCHANQE